MFFVMTVVLAVVGSHYQSALARRSLPYSARASSLAGIPVSSQNSDACRNHEGLCLTPGCVRAAAQLIDNMNMTVDPCTDFYEFACGGWIEKQNIPEEKSFVTQLSLLQDGINAQLRKIVEKPIDEARDPSFIVKLKHLYQSCMNTSYLDDLGNKPLEKILQDLGGWPVIEGDRWNESAFDWLETLIKLRELGYSHDTIFALSVIPDLQNNTRYLINLDQTILGRPERSPLIKGWTPHLGAYIHLVIDAATLLGAELDLYTRKQLAQSVMFETNLLEYSSPRKGPLNYTALYNKMTLGELKKLAPSISWDTFFNKLLVDPVSDDEPINVVDPKFVEQVANLLNRTDKRTLANYMIWRVVLESYPTLGKAWRDGWHKYKATISGATRESPRWEQCMSALTGSMTISLSNLYLKNYLRGSSEDDVLTIFNYTKNEFSKILQDVPWMDPQTRQRAMEKAEAIVPYVGYPSELLNDTLLIGIYENLTISVDGYFSNVLHVRKWKTDNSYEQLRKLNVKGEWEKHSQIATADAFYDLVENSINFSAGILQGVFFAKDRPNYLNFGAIGSAIGQELTHGFDVMGRQFDKDGNAKNWWEHETDESFEERAQCIIHQYENYTEPKSGLNVHGINTQNENIADNGGIKQAFRAYLQWEKDNGPEGALPGLNYTAHQLFWISAANAMCGKSNPEALRLDIISDSHSPDRFRVIGPMSNAPEFAEQFNCPLGSRMNPVHKCTVW